MNPLTIANVVANVIVIASVTDMAIRVFGNSDHRIHAHPELFYIRKFVSSLVICGAVLNIATLSTPNWTEIILNYGFAANYLFSCYYDRFTNCSSAGVVAKVPKPQRPRKPSGAPKTSPNFATTRKRRERASAR
jgi:hypothetical protein